MSSQVTIVQEKKSRKRWAAVGFLLIVALMTIAWFAAPALISAIKTATHGQFKTTGLTPIQLQIAFTLIIFVVLAILAALVVTMAAPKKAMNVRDKDLVKERIEGQKYQKMQRKRQRTLNREMREYVEKKNQK